jgi:DNA-binding NtrC family response regulator
MGSVANRRLIIIGMSANSDVETAKEAIDAGMDGFVAKPFNYKDFEQVISRLGSTKMQSTRTTSV